MLCSLHHHTADVTVIFLRWRLCSTLSQTIIQKYIAHVCATTAEATQGSTSSRIVKYVLSTRISDTQ